MSCDVGKATEGLENKLWRRWNYGKQSSFSNLSVSSPTSQLILQHFRCFTYVTVQSPTLLSLLLRHKLITLTSPGELILQTFRQFTYVTAHSPTLPSLYLRHSSFYNISVTSPTSQLILKPFRSFTYVTAHSPTLPLLHLRHAHSPNLLSLLLRHRLFTYVTSRAAHVLSITFTN